jgi:hypothetical protein
VTILDGTVYAVRVSLRGTSVAQLDAAVEAAAVAVCRDGACRATALQGIRQQVAANR